MSYHKKNLKEKIVKIAWDTCKTESWQTINMRMIAKKAGVSTTAFYRHFENKNDLKAELMRMGFEIIEQGRKNSDTFAGWGANYVRFGLDYPHIYDLMFGHINFDMSLYPNLEEKYREAFDGILVALKSFMPDASKKDIKIKAINIWTSVHGLIAFLRQSDYHDNSYEELKWIKKNLEDYLKMTTFR